MTSIANFWPKPLPMRGTAPITADTAAANLPTFTQRLTGLVLALVLPVLAFSGFMIVYNAQEQRTQYEQQIQATADASSLAIDAGISRQLGILTTLRNSRSLTNQEWSAFYDLAKASVADEPNARVVLYDPSGQSIVSTIAPYGTDLPKAGDPNAIRKVVETQKPYISDLFVGAVSREMAVAIYIPVIEAEAVVEVLGLVLPPQFTSKIIQGQTLPHGGFGVLIDSKGVIIARTRGQFVGHLAAPAFVEAAKKSSQGTYETTSVEGIPIRAAFTKSSLSGWTASLGIEKAAYDATLFHSLWVFGGGGALLFFAALLLAFLYGQKFVQPVVALTEMAQSLGRGDRLQPKHLALREMQLIGDQMVVAAEALKHHTDERENHLAMLEQRVRERTYELDMSATKYRQVASYARSLLEASLDPLVTISPEGKITDANKAAELATERPRDLLIGSEFASYFTEPEKARVGYQRVLAEGFVTAYPLVLKGVSGKLIDVVYNASIYRDEAGEIAGVFAAARDVTARKRAERELSEHQENLEETVRARTTELTESNEQLEAANKELEGFSYSVSHDLRTPLRAIDGFSRLLMDEHASGLGQEGLRLLNVVRLNTLKMSRLIDDILAFSRMGRTELKRAEVDMEAIARVAYKELESSIAGRSLEFKIGVLPKASADVAMIKQVFVNLLDNAIKYSAPNPKAFIEVEGHIESGEAVYVVRDNGAGFDMKYVGKLFGVFQRLHGPAEFSGTGIGLSIVKRIITRHGGRVWAEGKLDQGATFSFTLPRQEIAYA
jgi:PAS domain S-box-containing protein